MALTAKFLADFTDFYSAVNQATAKLDGLQASAAESGLALNKMVESLSGERTIKNAMSLAAAVEALGGTSKLTNAELEKVGRTAEEAIEKAVRLGVDVPPQLRELAGASRATAFAFDEGLASLTKFAAGFVTLAAAWKIVKAGFGMVSDFLAASVKAAAESSAIYSTEIKNLGASYKELQVAIGQTVTQNQTVITAMAGVSTALAGLAKSFAGNADVMNLVSDVVIVLIRSFGFLIDVFGKLLTPVGWYIKAQQTMASVTLKFVNVMLSAARVMAPFSDAAAEAVTKLEANVDSLNRNNAALQQAADFTENFQSVTTRLADESSKLADKLESTRGQTVAVAAAQQVAAVATTTHAVAAQQLTEALKSSALVTTTALPTVRAYRDEFEGLIPAYDELQQSMVVATTQTRGFGNVMNLNLPAVRAWTPAMEQAAEATQGFGETVQTYLGKEFGKNVVDALAGGGNVAKTAMAGLGNALVGPNSSLAKSLTSGIGKVFGESGMMGQIGKTLGSFVPMIGPMLGPAIDAVGQLFGKVFGKSEESAKVSPLRDEFFKLQGGIETLNPRVEQLTGNLSMVQAVFDAKTVEDYNAAIANLNNLFQQEQDALALVTETAQKYGLTLEELGPAFARQELDKKAQELYKDYQVLIAAGVKNTTVTKKMADEVNKYVQQALKMGVAVPSAMRPMIENMAKMGLLTDSSGKKIKDLEKAGVKFSMTMSEGFERLIDSVDSLTSVLANSLGVQLEKTKDKVNDIPDSINIKVKYDDKGYKPKGATVPGYQGGTKGFEDFGAGTLVMLHGREAVVPESAVKAGTSGVVASASAPGVTINIYAQGSFFDTPGDLQRLADKVNAALTAKHGLTNRLRAA